MKKLLLTYLLILITGFVANAQTDYYPLITGLSTSGNGRAPQGSQRYNRSIWLITAAEMTASGFANGSIVSSLGFYYLTAQNIPTTGNMTVYLQNTADATNTKSTTWATAITGMTTASNSSVTIPAVTGNVDFVFAGGSTFTYTGGALYIAFDYQNIAGTLSTSNVAACNTDLTGGLKGAISTTVNQTTVAASNFRPETRLGKSVTCARPVNLNVVSSTLNSANLSWTSSANVELEWGPYNFTQGSGTTITNVSSPYTLSGLAPSSAYEYYVRTNCGGSFSVWAGPYAFHIIFEATSPTYNT
ncbi:fibronectin type III domain-containing protein, partial [Flavobacterium sp.]|uniref:fibronectin type III domain-containing protein n=1 Tax=Flavobacterium sp. TaxID=239 RepID=UPI002B4AF1E0